MSTRSPLTTLSRPRLTALATAAILALGLAVTASPASAKAYCKKASQVTQESSEHDRRKYVSEVCIESRSGAIAVDAATHWAQVDRRYSGVSYYNGAGMNFELYENGRIVATKRCDVTKEFNEGNGIRTRTARTEHRFTKRFCPDVIRFPAKPGRTYQVRATLRLDYSSDDKGAFDLRSVYSTAIRR